MKIVISCLCLGLSASSLLQAQIDGTAAPGKANGRMAWFVHTSLPDGLENPVSVLVGESVIQVMLSKFAPSDPVKIPADGILRIVRKVANPKDPLKPGYLTIGLATVPATVSRALVILMPADKNPDGLLFRTNVQDLAAMQGGDTMFLNMTKLNIGIELGSAKFVVSPGQRKIHDALGTAQSVSLPIRLSYLDPSRKEWEMITASTVALYATRREMCVFNWDAKFNRVDYESITLPAIE